MRLSTTVAVAASVFGATNAIDLQAPRDATPKVVLHDVQRVHVENPLLRDRRRRHKRASKTVMVDLDNEETLYLMDVSVGTPAQNLRLHLDTGSSDLWVNVANSQLCQGRGNPCASTGTYSPNSSTTYKYINSQFSITYVDGSGSVGDYASETVSFGGATLTDQQFGIGYKSSSQEGIMGIGYPANEVAVAYNGGRSYANVPQKLMQSGITNTMAYSLWLNDLDASKGSILFGGVNTGKFQGTLQTVPIVRENGIYAELVIALTAVGHNGNVGSIANNQAVGALLDSGSSLMYLPDSIAQSIYDTLGATYDSQQGAAFIDCDQANNSSTIDFTFSGATIRVGLDELVIVAGYQGRQPVCILGLAPAGNSQPVLGDTFIRSAYIVYDLSNNKISLAQTNFNSTTDNILEITNSAVPSATPVASPVSSVTAEATGGHVNGGQATITASVGAAAPTAALGYRAALIGAAGVGIMAVL